MTHESPPQAPIPRRSRHDVINAYRVASSIEDLAIRLDVSIPTARSYCKQYGLETRIQQCCVPRRAIDLFRGYDGSFTVEEYAAQHSLTRSALKYQFDKAVAWLWSPRAQSPDKPPKELVYPPPTYALIRVVNAVWNDPSLIDYPRRIVDHTNLPQDRVIAYLNQCLEEYESCRRALAANTPTVETNDAAETTNTDADALELEPNGSGDPGVNGQERSDPAGDRGDSAR